MSDENSVPSREELDFELAEINRILYPEPAAKADGHEDPAEFGPYPGREPAGKDDKPVPEPIMQESAAQPGQAGDLPAGEMPQKEKDPAAWLAEVSKETAVARPKEKITLSGELFGWLQAIVTSLVFIVALFMLVVRIIGVSGISMVPTLHDKDMVVLLNSTIADFAPGDVIVFRQENYSEIPLVKRVIAIQGQTVDINFQTGTVYVDNAVSSFVDEPTYRSYDVTFPIVVEEGKLFVMGDNRDESFDSRASTIGQIDERSVLGKVAFVVYPFSRFGDAP